MECLTNIIGLSRTDCACFPAPTNQTLLDTQTSKTGLFLDEIEGMNLKLINAGTDCGNLDLYKMMDQCRRSATLELETALLTGLLARYKKARTAYFGKIGDDKYTKNLPQQAGTQDFRLCTSNLPGETIKVTGLGLMASVQQAITVQVNKYVKLNGELSTMAVFVDEVELTTSSTSINYQTAELELPCDGSEYSFSYLYDGSYQIRENQISCGCNVKDSYLFNYIRNIRYHSAKGLSLRVEINCNMDELICSNIEQQQVIKISMGYAIRFKAAQLLIAKIVHSGEVNRYTMLGMEQLQANSMGYQEKFQQHVDWMTGPDGINPDLNSCLNCKTSTNGIRQNIH